MAMAVAVVVVVVVVALVKAAAVVVTATARPGLVPPIISRNPDGVADYVHAPAGLVTSLILLTSFDSPSTIVKESVIFARGSVHRFRVRFSNRSQYVLTPRGSERLVLVLFLCFLGAT